MKNFIKKLITKLISDSITSIINPVLEDKLYCTVIFFVENKTVDYRNMFVIPVKGDKVIIKHNSTEKVFIVSEREIISPTGYEIHVHGYFI